MTVPPSPPPPATWEAVLSAALVGTARRPAPVSDLLLAGGAGDRRGPEGKLLATAAVLSAWRRAGRRPAPAPRQLPDPAGDDPRPLCSEPAAQILELVVSGEIPIPGGAGMLARQWVEGAARAGCRPPPRLLPRLLELGTSQPALRPRLVDVVGPRGRWVARHHDGWAWAADGSARPDEPPERRFATAGRSERLALLTDLRATDPDRARELVAAGWRKESAAERAALLGALATGLSDADEPFLEAALDDRAGAVRAGAVELLARLPRSARAARMAERLRPLVALARDGARGRRGRAGGSLSVGRPPVPDAAARRDGVTDTAPSGVGPSSWWLVQIVAGTPLGFWTDHLGLGPAEVVALAAGDAPEVLTGLEMAAAAQAGRADPAWPSALFAARPTPATLAALPPGLAATTLARFLAAPPPAGAPVAALLDACPGPWPDDLATAVVERYQRLGAKAVFEVGAALAVLAERLDPSVLPRVEAWAAGLSAHGEQGLRRRVQTLTYALSLRAVITREFP